ncbi:MAG: phosphoglucosamine mutase [Armatimonadetes bacterium]|nr:MAG: phosphoglucosamine mutase [Armatimonadota bacterium]
MEDTNQRLFGTDGVRGVANSDLTVDLALNLARAAGSTIAGHVVIGRDTRRSGPMLSSAVAAGFNSVGIDTVDLGIIPVGGVSRLARDTGASLGVMVSASHNPAEDNGIKFFGKDGSKLSDDLEAAIEARYFSSELYSRPVGATVGIQTHMAGSVERYVDKISQTVEYSMRGLEFVVDCANGAAFSAAPVLFDKVGASVDIIADTPDGMNINAGVGATHPEAVAAVANGRVAFAFDGDADRLIAVDENGEVCDGDVIMAIFAKWQQGRGKLKHDTVVATVMSNLGFHHAMERLGVKVVVTPVGDRYVVEAMRKTQAVVGGEQSGHILLEDRCTGDGLRTALRLMEVMAATGQPLSELRKVMTELPQILLNVRVGSKDGWESDPDIAASVKTAERALGPRGRVLVRASGTEPLIRVMVEAPTAGEATTIAESIIDVVRDRLS